MNYGLQLYSVRDVAEQNYEEALKQVAEIGYKMVETAGLFGNAPEDVAKMLEKYGLTACSTHTGVKDLAADLDGVIAMHKAIGCKDIIIPSSKFKTAEKAADTIAFINEIQPKVEAAGMRLHYHNHSKEFWPNEDGQIFFEMLRDQTKILFEFDTFWLFNAGLDPLEMMETYKDRISFIHLKDGIPQDRTDPASKIEGKSLGSGKAPAALVRKKAIEMGLTIVVESEDLTPSGPEEVGRCMDFLKAQDALDA